MILSDEMKTPQGIVEGTAATFSNSWKANFMCSDIEERLDDPCSLSLENGNQQLWIFYSFESYGLLLVAESYALNNSSAVEIKIKTIVLPPPPFRDVCQTLVRLTCESRQCFCPVPIGGGSRDVLQGMKKIF